jgi:hypothetical protein
MRQSFPSRYTLPYRQKSRGTRAGPPKLAGNRGRVQFPVQARKQMMERTGNRLLRIPTVVGSPITKGSAAPAQPVVR